MIENSRGSERKSTDTFFDEERKLSYEGEMCNQPTHNENIVPSEKNLVPTPQQCQDQMRAILRDRYDFTPKVIRSSSEFENLLNTLIYVHGITETIRVQNGLHLVFCLEARNREPNCELIFKATYNPKVYRYCPRCRKNKRNETKEKKRLDSRGGNLSKKVNLRYLSKKELRDTIQVLKEEIDCLKKNLNQLQEQTEPVDYSKGLKGHLIKMCNDVLEMNDKNENSISSHLTGVTHDLRMTEVTAMSEFLTQELLNFKAIIQHSEEKIRFSPHILQVALSLWVKSGTRAYDEFRKSSYIVYPSLRSLKNVSRKWLSRKVLNRNSTVLSLMIIKIFLTKRRWFHVV